MLGGSWYDVECGLDGGLVVSEDVDVCGVVYRDVDQEISIELETSNA